MMSKRVQFESRFQFVMLDISFCYIYKCSPHHCNCCGTLQLPRNKKLIYKSFHGNLIVGGSQKVSGDIET